MQYQIFVLKKWSWLLTDKLSLRAGGTTFYDVDWYSGAQILTAANTTQTTTHPCFAMGSPRSGYPLGLNIERISLHFTYFQWIKLQILGQIRDNNKTAKIHTTNYFNTFIEVADDCISNIGLIPPQKGDTQSIANFQFDLISKNPYTFTSDDNFFWFLPAKCTW